MANKKGANFYYDYLDNEFSELNLKEVGALTLALLATDCKREIREDAQEVINSERLLRILFGEMSGKTARATEKWHITNNRFEESQKIKAIMKKYKCSEEEARDIYEKYENTKKTIAKSNSDTTKEQIQTTEEITEIPYILNTSNIKNYQEIAKFSGDKYKNIPNEENLQYIIDAFGLDCLSVSEFFENGNKDNWNKHYKEYTTEDIKQLIEEELEGPF